MQILLIRHATAEEQAESDELRPLSEKGIVSMRENVKGLQKVISKIDRLVNSPLLRAQQTADLIAVAYPDAQRDTLPALAPHGYEVTVLEYLQRHAETAETIALVGHEPSLGQLASWLLTAEIGRWLPLKKGAACLLEFPGKIKAGKAELSWALKPAQLRQLSKVVEL
jgi:phosphohistidine phosphatase